MYKYQEIIITEGFTKKISFKTYKAALQDIIFWKNRAKEIGYKELSFQVIDKTTKQVITSGKFDF